MSDSIQLVSPLREIAERMGCSVSTIRKWKLLGRKQAHMNGRAYPEFTWLPTGEWGMTQEQYDAFITKLNEKP